MFNIILLDTDFKYKNRVYLVRKYSRTQGLLLLEFNSKMKLGDQLKNFISI